MPMKKRNYKQEFRTEQARNETADRSERQRARRAMDKAGKSRAGKDISHTKALASGGTNADGYKLESAAKNRSRNGHKPGEKQPHKKMKVPK